MNTKPRKSIRAGHSASRPARSATAPILAGAEPKDQLERIRRGLKLVTVPMPYLAGLAAAVRVALDNRVPTMGVFASGRMVANPEFAAKLKDNELIFVLAHELLHLALRTHDRARGSHHLEFNYAHDYIINDILRAELGFTKVPAGGLDMPGAKEKGAEEIVLEIRRNAQMQSKTQVFDGQQTTVGRLFGPGKSGGKRNGDAPQEGEAGAGDVLDDKREREMFPGEVDAQQPDAEAMREAAAKALALAKTIGALKGMRGADGGGQTQIVSALRGLYRVPWEVALQRWLESVAPGERTFARPSRRGAERDDLVMPGRKREGWMLNIVLDTSGSMDEEIPRALGAIADFGDAVAVDQVRLLQCDTAVTGDEMLSPSELSSYKVTGYGGSDLSPAMERLAEDSQVRAVIVITDGDIAYPPERMPYEVLWVLTPGASAGFHPAYGRIVLMQPA